MLLLSAPLFLPTTSKIAGLKLGFYEGKEKCRTENRPWITPQHCGDSHVQRAEILAVAKLSHRAVAATPDCAERVSFTMGAPTRLPHSVQEPS